MIKCVKREVLMCHAIGEERGRKSNENNKGHDVI